MPKGWLGQQVQALLEVRLHRSLLTKLSGKLKSAVEEGISTAVVDNSQNCRNSTQTKSGEGKIASLNKSVVQGGGKVGKAQVRSSSCVKPGKGKIGSMNKSVVRGGDNGQVCVACLNKSVVQGGGEVGQAVEIRNPIQTKSGEGKTESGKPKLGEGKVSGVPKSAVEDGISIVEVENSQICRSCTQVESREDKIQRCSRCKVVCYCSESCQQEHWSKHKVLCNAISHLESDKMRKCKEACNFVTNLSPRNRSKLLRLIGEQCKVTC